MLQIVRKYKSVLRFILTFLGTYLVLSFCYNYYLNHAESQQYYPEYITHVVAEQSSWAIEIFGYESYTEPHPTDACMKLLINDAYLSRVVEGCNAVSVMILFVAFVLAFFNGWRKTILFILLGLVAIYVLNIFRIALLTIALYEYPEYRDVLHDIVFPAVIYGFVFLLWIYWVNRATSKK